MFYECHVLYAGYAADNNDVCIWLREVSGKFDDWFLSPKESEMQSKMLATALAAVTSGQRVQVGFSGEEVPKAYSRIWNLYLKCL